MDMDMASGDSEAVCPPLSLATAPLSSASTAEPEEKPSTSVSSTPSEDNIPVIRDIDEYVEEASDRVCNSGLDDEVVVENDDGHDGEERRVARFLSTGCKCNGRPCYANFTAS